METCSIRLVPENTSQTFEKGTLLLDALMEMGIMLKTPCGGRGTCGKCSVKVHGSLSEPTDQEKKFLINRTEYRLACQASITGDVEVFIDRAYSIKSKQYPMVNSKGLFSIAVDIGTTSVKISIVDHSSNRSYKLDDFLNPQRKFGYDVITRIAAAADPKKHQIMIRQIRNILSLSISEACNEMSISHNQIEAISFSGNTTMLYLLFGIDVQPLGKYPYTAERLDFNNFSAADIDAKKFFNSKILALPAASSFLGSDFMGGLAICHERDLTKNVYFIDLGTNGEMFLINSNKKIFATSCAIGPALEGMNISCGMTADTGAITHAWIESGSLQYQMIGTGRPAGITGTAVIDIISILLKKNIIQVNGTFIKNHSHITLPSPLSFSYNSGIKQVTLWNNLALTQKDIRNVQLAKAASLAASRILLREAVCSEKEIKYVVISGAFGEHLEIDNFKRLEFIPNFPNAEYHYFGNTSLEAAQRVCLDKNFLKKVKQLRERINEVELSQKNEFNNEFINAINFN